MKQILVYADSLSWGIIPGSRSRLEFKDRWPGILESNLLKQGFEARVIENCLNGRRTVWEDPFKPGRNGLTFLGQTIEIHSPLDLVILMLGTNDFQSSNPSVTAWQSTTGLGCVINEIRQAPIEPGMPIPPIIVVSPPKINQLNELSAEKFAGAPERSEGLSERYRELANDMGCGFVASEDYIKASAVDGIHLDSESHLALGSALTSIVEKSIFEN